MPEFKKGDKVEYTGSDTPTLLTGDKCKVLEDYNGIGLVRCNCGGNHEDISPQFLKKID